MKKLKTLVVVALCIAITFCFCGCAQMQELKTQTKQATTDFFEYIRQEDYHSALTVFRSPVMDADDLKELVRQWEKEEQVDFSLPFKIILKKELEYSHYSSYTGGPELKVVYWVEIGDKKRTLRVISTNKDDYFGIISFYFL
ncbi:MAG: hypothetical protein IJV77_05435 [Clostridia bacterium]|nr:hypothetical protein [Clostridia bacterium]